MLAAAAAVVLACPARLPAAATPAPGGTHDAPTTYHNPVTTGYSIDFPDPTVMRGKDGQWYAYSTGGPYDEQRSASAPLKMARSSDLTHWSSLGAVFDADNRPSWATPTTGFWAPDIRTINGRYLLYFAVPNTTAGGPAIGVATAPTPAGPWTDSGAPLIPHHKLPNGRWQSIIDPAEFTDTDGTHYLYYGSFNGGIWVVPLTPDGLHPAGAARQVASSRFEGAYVIKHDGWYYLMASSGNCCAGPTTGYTVFAGRSHSPFGPFLDADGHSLLASRSGGTIVIAPNGNRWIGTGHNAVVTDLSGRTWMAYHAIDRHDPYLDVQPGFTMRPMLLDPIDWVHGWPTVRMGHGASDRTERAPVTTGAVDEQFDASTGSLHASVGTITAEPPSANTSDSGGFARLAGDRTVATSTRPVPRDTRVEADVRTPENTGTVGVVVRQRHGRTGITAVVDANRRMLRVTATIHGRARTAQAALPAEFDPTVWHNLAVEVRGRRLTAIVTDARLADPYARVTMRLPRALSGAGRAGVAGTGTVDVDNVSAARLFAPSHGPVAQPPRVGPVEPAYSDEFDADTLSSAWSWVRQDSHAHLDHGALVWPTEAKDLTIASNNQAGILLRTPPEGAYVLETRLHLPVGVGTVRNWQQAGLIVYLDDHHFLRLDVVAKDETRITEFGKMMPIDGLISWGAGVLGPPGDTTWLRIAHWVDPRTGENLYRGGSSDDGVHWTWGLTWTLPAGTHPKIGLVSQGALAATNQDPGPALARFDYVRIHR